MLRGKDNYLPMQLLFCSFILLFNLLKIDKRVIVLFIVLKKFPFICWKDKKLWVPLVFLFSIFSTSLLFSSLPNNPILYFPSQNLLKVFLPSSFPLYQTDYKCPLLFNNFFPRTKQLQRRINMCSRS